MMRRFQRWGAAALTVLAISGCQTLREAERFGKIYYLDGAGNWGWGTSGIKQGMEQAGYQGDVEVFLWTTSLNPLVDQLNVPGAKLRAFALARKMEDYRKRFPDTQINVVGLSAGTGVAVWATEALRGGTKIHNMVLLGSSLSHDYDITKTLSNMTGDIYVYYSPRDSVLGAVKLIGTIDGKRGVKSAGEVGLTVPPGMERRVHNISWSPDWAAYGWTGGHLGVVDARFVRHIVAHHLLNLTQTVRTPVSNADHVSINPETVHAPSEESGGVGVATAATDGIHGHAGTGVAPTPVPRRRARGRSE